ncbi:hypothetical protein BJV74DRAFT_984284 [Russula compacta]|nr:hypothetical protein BJV74DRAFT_984284 [Russula compacta]
MYGLLFLTTEQGSSGLVNKIVIDQQSLHAFINALCPGAYASIRTINFRILDSVLLKPIGVYGSKEEIVRFLREIDAVDDNAAQKLLMPQNSHSPGATRGEEPTLKSGLYVVRLLVSTGEEQAYVLYSPEDTTWNQYASSTVQRNRIMFMRYLTKLCDQIVCLLSSEHSQAIVWGDEDGDGVSTNPDNEDPGWLYDFVVAKTNDQEENVVATPGFTMNSPLLVRRPPPPKMHLDPKILSPRLLHGESMQGFMTAKYKQGKTLVEPFTHDHQSASQIRLLLADDVVLCLSKTIDDNSLKTLMELALKTQFSNEYTAWERRRNEITQRFKGTLSQRQVEMHRILVNTAKVMSGHVATEAYMRLPTASLYGTLRMHTLHDLFRIYPKTEQTFRRNIRAANLEGGIKASEFPFKKERILILQYLLENINSLDRIQIRSAWKANTELGRSIVQISSGGSGGQGINHSNLTKEEAMWRDATDFASSLSDSNFLSQLKKATVDESLRDATVKTEETACACLAALIKDLVAGIGQQIFSTQKEDTIILIDKGACSRNCLNHYLFTFLNRSLHRYWSKRTGKPVPVDPVASGPSQHLESYYISGRQESLQNQEIECHVYTLRLRSDQRHNLQLDYSFVPTPVVNERLSQSFCVPSDTIVKYAHLLEGDRILVVLVDSQGNVMILLERLTRIDAAIKNRSYAKFFHKDKIGQTCLIAFDETKRMLAVYASARMQLHIFVFDEELKSLRGLGTAIDLLPFYHSGASIVHACFVHGSEEILFVDSGAHAKIFSLIMLQPKPASLQLPQVPRAVYSAPDGSCVLVIQEQDGVSSLTAYHWSTFASTSGISVTLPDFPVDLNSALLTSIVYRNNIHLIGLDLESRSCRSVILGITRKATEFTFQERRPKGSSGHGNPTVHNCLIDCHADVWTRFPVVPAVKRHTIISSSERRQKTLVFVTNEDRRPFSSHFSDIIHTFERASRKPTGDELKNISVSARTFTSFSEEFLSNPDWPASRFRAGEWLMDLLCLIPIHIAIPHENGFVPLKDGAVSERLEKPGTGGDVYAILDSLSFGWYESIFRSSHWASKPVKVVSSMGEQSVGKSFALNHLVDTSFAGSATRPTKGVWMSVSPTDDALIAALNFEGVHSPEYSAQEDTLLILFNTAISNLVLFHNNFSLSRDITGLIQPFQSSSGVMDPTSNPSLFRSTLIVIIKDVIDSDRADVTRE